MKSEHQDLSALRVKHPEAAWRIPVLAETTPSFDFSMTKEVNKPIEDHWNKTVATQFAPDEIPSKGYRPAFVVSKTASMIKSDPYLLQKWQERAKELNRTEVPQDLRGACKFASLYAQRLYGGELQGNKNHQWVNHPEYGIIDLTGNPDNWPYEHDSKFWMNPEHAESMKSIEPRVDAWITQAYQQPRQSNAKEAAQTGWTDFYHATPRKNRESIQNYGLIGADGESPWEYTWDQPRGNYFFDNPEDAIAYARNTVTRTGVGQPRDEEEYWTHFPEPPLESRHWDDDEWERYYEDSEMIDKRDYPNIYEDPDAWDIWKVDTRGLPINRDPESAATINRMVTPNDVRKQFQKAYEDRENPSWEDQYAKTLYEHGGEPRRFYTEEQVHPNRLTLHQSVPMWDYDPNQDEGAEGDEYEADSHPSVWDEAQLHRPLFPPHSNIKTADKLHDFLMNPKSRPDLQTPEAQELLRRLKFLHNEKTDQLMPWLAREWKKGRLMTLPDEHYLRYEPMRPNQRGNVILNDRLDHWADFMNSNHPLKREMGDIMQHPIHEFSNRIDQWDEDLANREAQEAAAHGQVVHTTPDGWTIRRLTRPEELTAEGDNMSHCVGGYWPDVERGSSQIYSLRDPNGAPHTTLEIEPKMVPRSWQDRVDQFLGPEWIQRNGQDKYQSLLEYPDFYNDRNRRLRENGQLSDPDPEEYKIPQRYLDIQGLANEINMHTPTETYSSDPYNGNVIQIQGKGNREPIDQYKERLRHWFESMPFDQRPKMENDDYYGGLIDPDEIEDVHLNPDGVNEYGLPMDPPQANYDSLVRGTISPGPAWSHGVFEPHLADRVYQLAKVRNEIPQLAQAVQTHSDKAEDEWDHYNNGIDHYGIDPDDYKDENGEYDEESMWQAHQDAEDEMRSQHPPLQVANHFYEKLSPHWNPESNQYENGTFD